jgi:microcystin-dependent protein
MADPFIGEIRMMPYQNFLQEGWLPCHGQILAVSEYTTLFSLLYNTFGGNGQTTFGIPDLRGRVPVHPGYNIHWGHYFGANLVTLTSDEIPTHSHDLQVSVEDAVTDTPSSQTSLGIAGNNTNVYTQYTGSNNLVTMEDEVGSKGGSQGHYNMQPYQAVDFFIAYEGIYPSRN